MMSIMIYCNDESMYNKIKKNIKSDEHIILVSANVQLLNSQPQDVTSIILDSELPYFSKETFEILNNINQAIKKISTKTIYDIYIYEMEMRIEGGFGGRIQTLLYLIDIFNRIIQNNHIQKIYCERIAGNLENEALFCVANYYKIAVQIYNNSSMKQRIYYSSFFPFVAVVNLYCYYNIIKEIRDIAKKSDKDREIEYFDVGYVMWGGANKHANWAIERTSAYDSVLKTGIFNYCTGEGLNRLLSMGKNAKSVETYGDWKIIIRSYIGYIWDKLIILANVNKKLQKDRIYFQNVDVTKSVLYMFRAYINQEKLKDVIYDNMVSEFLKFNKFKLFTGNGDTNFISNKSFFFNAQKQGMNFMGFTDATQISGITYPVDFISKEPYPEMISFAFFCKNDEAALQLLSDGWKGDYYFYPDSILFKWYDRENDSDIITRDNDIEESVKVLWVPGKSVYGLYSVTNFTQDNYRVILGINNFSCSLRVKYHLGQDVGSVEQIRSSCKKYNVDWIDEHEPIEPHIQWADVVITTPSIVLFDAAMRGKLAVCISTDLSLRYLDHIKEYFYIVKREDADFETILYDIDFRKKWIERQEAFFKDNLQVSEEKPMVEILQHYIDKLDKRGSKEG